MLPVFTRVGLSSSTDHQLSSFPEDGHYGMYMCMQHLTSSTVPLRGLPAQRWRSRTHLPLFAPLVHVPLHCSQTVLSTKHQATSHSCDFEVHPRSPAPQITVLVFSPEALTGIAGTFETHITINIDIKPRWRSQTGAVPRKARRPSLARMPSPPVARERPPRERPPFGLRTTV